MVYSSHKRYDGQFNRTVFSENAPLQRSERYQHKYAYILSAIFYSAKTSMHIIYYDHVAVRKRKTFVCAMSYDFPWLSCLQARFAHNVKLVYD